ncbi:ABC transporter substrate-binding protein [Streptomyces sp. NPDC096205]|uniref:ABC transporter substrate-binding protein n=1 Tax=Streptomyces sp. NPDC096205 TaxID=3366081 RepID=UPI0038169A7D
MDKAKIGTALLGGYLLGRSKKAKLAVGLGAMLAGSRIRPDQIGKTLQESPFLKDISKQVRSELTGAGKAAASSVLTAKADSLADALQARTSGLRQKSRGAPDAEGDAEEADVDKSEVDEAEADEADEDERDVDQADEGEETDEAEEETEDTEDTKDTEARDKPAKKKSGKSAGGRSTAARSGSKGTKTTKKTAAPSRSRSGTSARSRRSDDG